MLKWILLISIGFLGAPQVAFPRQQSPADAHRYEETDIATATGNAHFKSRRNRAIPLIRIDQSPQTTHRYYLQAALHGNERLTREFALWVSQRIRSGKSPLNKLNNGQAGFDIVPVANPDGFAADSRLNASSVNLNRNFSYLWGMSKEFFGTIAFSENETQAIRALFTQNQYSAAVDIHGYVNWVVMPTEPTTGVDQVNQKKYQKLKQALSRHLALLNKNYLLKTAGGLGDGGAFEDWAFWEMATPAFCLEMSNQFREDITFKSNKVTTTDSFISYENYIYTVFKEISNNTADQTKTLAQN